MPGARTRFSGLRVNHYQVIAVGDDHGRRIGQRNISVALVGAAITPQYFASNRIDRTHAIRTAGGDLAIFQSCELSPGPHVQYTCCQDQFRCEPQIFCLPDNPSGRAQDCPHSPSPGGIKILLIPHGIGFSQCQAFFVDTELFANPLPTRPRIERSNTVIEKINATFEK